MREILGLFFRRAGADVLARLATLVLLFFLARCWSVAFFGRFALALTIGTVASLVMDGGCHLIFLREFGRSCGDGYSRDASSFRVWKEYVSAKMMTVAMGVGVGLLAVFVFWPWKGFILPLSLVCWAVGQSWVEFLNVIPNATGRIEWSAFLLGSHRILTIGPALWVALRNSSGPTEVGVCLGLGSVVAAALGHFLTSHRFFGDQKGPLHWREGVRSLRRVGWVGGALAIYTVGFRMGIFLLPRLSDAAQVGYYGAVHKLIESALMVPVALMLVSTRFLVALPDARDRKRMTKKMGVIVSVVAILWFAAGQWAAPLGIRMAFGSAWGPSVSVFRWILVASALGFINCFLYHVMVMKDLLSNFFWVEVVGFGVSLATTFFFAERFGAIGAALGLICFESARLLLGGFTVWRTMRDDLSQDVKTMPVLGRPASTGPL